MSKSVMMILILLFINLISEEEKHCFSGQEWETIKVRVYLYMKLKQQISNDNIIIADYKKAMTNQYLQITNLKLQLTNTVKIVDLREKEVKKEKVNIVFYSIASATGGLIAGFLSGMIYSLVQANKK